MMKIICNTTSFLSRGILVSNQDGNKFSQWKGINRKQSTRWQHLSRLKASVFFSFAKKISCYEAQQLILGTGTAIWWVTEPHCYSTCEHGQFR